MTYTRTGTSTTTFSTTYVEYVVRKLHADFNMIACSTGAITRQLASDYIHDILLFAINDAIDLVDVTLMSGNQEKRAIQYEVDSQGGISSDERPGGVLWPYLPNGHIRVLLKFRDDVTTELIERIKGKCQIQWGPSDDNYSHSGMSLVGGRSYFSSTYGMNRKDWK